MDNKKTIKLMDHQPEIRKLRNLEGKHIYGLILFLGKKKNWKKS